LGTGSDSNVSWFTVVKPIIAMSFSIDGAWYSNNADGRPAGEVLGTIP
jgi:hypothetical protein